MLFLCWEHGQACPKKNGETQEPQSDSNSASGFANTPEEPVVNVGGETENDTNGEVSDAVAREKGDSDVGTESPRLLRTMHLPWVQSKKATVSQAGDGSGDNSEILSNNENDKMEDGSIAMNYDTLNEKERVENVEAHGEESEVVESGTDTSTSGRPKKLYFVKELSNLLDVTKNKHRGKIKPFFSNRHICVASCSVS